MRVELLWKQLSNLRDPLVAAGADEEEGVLSRRNTQNPKVAALAA
jgi:hypothetical protein